MSAHDTPATGSAASHELERLLAIMARLRDPQGGCPWDLEQDFSTIAPYTIEEAYEVADAIDRGDLDDLCDELGDLLLQVVFHARMAEEQGAFAFAEVARAISDKMQRRHPHVFADASVDDADGVMRNWEAIKRAERAAKGEQDSSALAGISRGLPEWQRAVKLQSRAAKVGFDWPGPLPVLDKAAEELQELREEFERGDIAGNKARLQEELGDLLFVCANLARHADIDPGAALRGANHKFERRFRAMEAQAEAQGQSLSELDLDAQEALWQHAKAAEKTVKTLGLFLLTALAEIVGCYLPWLWLRKAGSAWLLLPAAASLALFAWLLTLHPTASGRVYAAYGGVYIGTALFWLWLVDGIRPSRWDLLGATLCLAGMAVIMFGPRQPV